MRWTMRRQLLRERNLADQALARSKSRPGGLLGASAALRQRRRRATRLGLEQLAHCLNELLFWVSEVYALVGIFACSGRPSGPKRRTLMRPGFSQSCGCARFGCAVSRRDIPHVCTLAAIASQHSQGTDCSGRAPPFRTRRAGIHGGTAASHPRRSDTRSSSACAGRPPHHP